MGGTASLVRIARNIATAFACTALALVYLACDEDAPARDTSQSQRPPSLILITLDTTRADALGTYGQVLPVSPEIDRMAAEGVVFENAVTSSPSTLPSHASILTGLQPYAHGVRSNLGYALPPEYVTLAEILRGRGYRTGAEISSDIMARSTRLDQGFDVYHDPFSASVRRRVMIAEDEMGRREIETSERGAEDITRMGLAFLERNRDRPFFLWLHYYDPHRLWVPPEPFLAQVPESPYHAEIRSVDHHIGRVRAEIERLGLRERVLVAIVADHGEGLDEHNEPAHSFYVYDTTMRVPFVLWGPGLLPVGRRVDPLVRTIDLLPTVLEVLGVDPPAGVQGQSLLPLLAERAPDSDRIGYGESIELHVAFGSAVLRFVREGDWKYIHKVNPELFDLASDPGETRNLVDERPERLEALRARLHALLEAAPRVRGPATIEVDDETLDRLAALGYIASDHVASEDALSSLDLEGPDPTDLIGDTSRMGEGLGQLRVEAYEAARATYQGLLDDHPRNPRAIDGLINALRGLGRIEETIPALELAIEVTPQDLRYYGALGLAYMNQGDPERGERALRAATEIDACASESRRLLAALLSLQRRYEEQIAVFEAGLAACEDASTLWNDASYALATVPIDRLRDGTRAVALAESAVGNDDAERPATLDTLAVAYAEQGDFSKARDVELRAIGMLERQGASDVALAPYRAHLAEIEAGRAIREGEDEGEGEGA